MAANNKQLSRSPIEYSGDHSLLFFTGKQSQGWVRRCGCVTACGDRAGVGLSSKALRPGRSHSLKNRRHHERRVGRVEIHGEPRVRTRPHR